MWMPELRPGMWATWEPWSEAWAGFESKEEALKAFEEAKQYGGPTYLLQVVDMFESVK